jgi:transcriptional regulator with XRE-family HTH domain
MAKRPKTIGAQIRAAREAKKMTEEEFAWALGVPPRRVSLWEAGAPEPLDVTMLDRIARVLGTRFIIE